MSSTSSTQKKDRSSQRNTVNNRKTDLSDSLVTNNKNETKSNSDLARCPLHNAGHSLNQCRGFRSKPIADRREFLRDKKICFRCCNSTSHKKPDCTADIQCSECGSVNHSSAMHVTRQPSGRSTDNGGENSTQSSSRPVNTTCTQICGENVGGKSCAKTMLVRIYLNGKPEQAVQTYAIVDDQSNRSLANSTLFDQLRIRSVSSP